MTASAPPRPVTHPPYRWCWSPLWWLNKGALAAHAVFFAAIISGARPLPNWLAVVLLTVAVTADLYLARFLARH